MPSDIAGWIKRARDNKAAWRFPKHPMSLAAQLSLCTKRSVDIPNICAGILHGISPRHSTSRAKTPRSRCLITLLAHGPHHADVQRHELRRRQRAVEPIWAAVSGASVTGVEAFLSTVPVSGVNDLKAILDVSVRDFAQDMGVRLYAENAIAIADAAYMMVKIVVDAARGFPA